MASTLEALLLAQMNFLMYPPTADLYQITTQSPANTTQVPITMDGTRVDNYSGHSNVTNPSRWTNPVAGRYWAKAQVGWAPNATGNRLTQLAINGVALNQAQQSEPTANANNNHISDASGSVFLNVGDYIEVWGYQQSGGPLATVTLLSSLQLWWTGAV